MLDTRSQAILQLISELRYVTAELLLPLLEEEMTGKRGRGGGFGLAALRARLTSLRKGNFIRLHRLSDQTQAPGLGGPPHVYGLGSKAAYVLGSNQRETDDYLRRANNETPTSGFLRHELLRTRLLVWLKLAERMNPESLIIEAFRWDSDIGIAGEIEERLIVNGAPQVIEHSQKVTPDLYIRIRRKTADGYPAHNYFVELDTGSRNLVSESLHHSSLLRKCRVYREYAKDDSGHFQEHFGAQKFQVIWVMKTESRIENARAALLANNFDKRLSLIRFLALDRILIAEPDKALGFVLSGLQDSFERYTI